MVREMRSMIGELRTLDLNVLVALRALLDEQHVSRAADRAGLTQPGMSRALKRLRAMFDDPLLVKADHGYELTARAREIDGSIERVLSEILHIMAPSTFDPLRATGEFRIASVDYELQVLMPSLISVLRQKAPGIRVSASNHSGLDYGPLMRGDVHLVLSAYDQAPPNLYRKQIFHEDNVCLAAIGHPGIGPSLSIEEFPCFDHVWVNLTAADPVMIDRTLASHGLSRNLVVMAPSFVLAARIVAATDLITILTRRIALPFVERGVLKIVGLPFSFPRFPIYQYWHERTNRNPQQQWLRQVVADVARSLGEADALTSS